MPVWHKTPYPVVDPNPTFLKALQNFNIYDCMTIGAYTAVGYGVGWFGAARRSRTSHGRFLSIIGFMGGVSYAVLSSSQRLCGIYPNAGEVIKYGALSPELLEQHPGHLPETYKLIGRKSVD